MSTCFDAGMHYRPDALWQSSSVSFFVLLSVGPKVLIQPAMFVSLDGHRQMWRRMGWAGKVPGR